MAIIRQGYIGPDVGKVQQDLVEAGFTIDAQELSASAFGDSTRAAVVGFQICHKGPDGHVLLDDGVVGPKTQWALENPGTSSKNPGGKYISSGWRRDPSRDVLKLVLDAAVGEIGVHEIPDGSNRGPDVDKYGGDGQPWCAFWASWCYKRLDTGSPFGVIGSAKGVYSWAEQHNRLLSEAEAVSPVPGDIFIILRADGHGHVGIIVGKPDNDAVKVCTVEGNCSNAVRGMLRDKFSFSGIARPVPL